ncbi:MAG: ROK family protein [Candidatus Eisenbacteria bacterium]
MRTEGCRIGIDLGGTKTEGVLLGSDPVAPLARRRIPTPRGSGYASILSAVVDLARSLLDEAAGDVPGIGVGIPGTISGTHRRVKNANTTELIGHPLEDDLASALGIAVRCENDANCFALAEALHGAGRGARCVFGVILGTGVGGGIVHDGVVWPGAQGIAGEWGHNLLDAGGPPCYCGRRGCVETFLSGPALARAYREAGGGTGGSADEGSREGGRNREATARDVFEREAEGDPIARAVLAEYRRRLGQGLAQVVNILDPDVIVLGGGVSNAPGLAESAPDLLFPFLFNDESTTVVRRHELGDSAGVLGAAWLDPRERIR